MIKPMLESFSTARPLTPTRRFSFLEKCISSTPESDDWKVKLLNSDGDLITNLEKNANSASATANRSKGYCAG